MHKSYRFDYWLFKTGGTISELDNEECNFRKGYLQAALPSDG